MKLTASQETLLFPLIGRCRAAERWPRYFTDDHAKTIVQAVGEEALTKEVGTFANLSYGLRYKLNVHLAKSYLSHHPKASVVNLGAGLDSLYDDIDNGQMRYFSVDFPEVIELREQHLKKHDREKNIASDMLKPDWLNALSFNSEDGIIFLAAGVFYFLHVEDVKSLIQRLADRFPGGRLTFDNENPWLIEKSNRMIQKKGVNDAPLHFIIEDPKVIELWSKQIKRIDILTDFLFTLPDTRDLPLYVKLIMSYLKRKEAIYQVIIDFK